MSEQPVQATFQRDGDRVVVTDIRMPFWSMVIFMLKWTIASLPALLILFVVFLLTFGALAGVSIGVLSAAFLDPLRGRSTPSFDQDSASNTAAPAPESTAYQPEGPLDRAGRSLASGTLVMDGAWDEHGRLIKALDAVKAGAAGGTISEGDVARFTRSVEAAVADKKLDRTEMSEPLRIAEEILGDF